MDKKAIASTFALMLVFGTAQAQTGNEQTGQPGSGGEAAQGQAPSGAPGMQQDPQAAQQRMQARQRLQEIQRQLGDLQQQAMKENPELKKRANKLDDRLLDKMESLGYENVREDIARLEETIKQLEEGSLAEQEDAQARLKKDRELQMKLQQAQREAMQDEEFMQSWGKDRRKLEQDLISAMKELDSQTNKLLEELQQLQAQMQQGRNGMGRGGQ